MAENERVDVELHVGDSTVFLSLVGIQVECAAEITGAVVKEILNVQQRNRRQDKPSPAASPSRFGPNPN